MLVWWPDDVQLQVAQKELTLVATNVIFPLLALALPILFGLHMLQLGHICYRYI